MINGAEGRGPLSLQGLKIGLPQDAFIGPLDAGVRQAWRAALLVLQEEGAEVVEDVELPRPSFEMYRTIQKPEAALMHMQKGWFPEKSDLYTERTRGHLLEGQKILAVDYLINHEVADRVRREFDPACRIRQHIHQFTIPARQV